MYIYTFMYAAVSISFLHKDFCTDGYHGKVLVQIANGSVQIADGSDRIGPDCERIGPDFERTGSVIQSLPEYWD
jgi:hypothetical protein